MRRTLAASLVAAAVAACSLLPGAASLPEAARAAAARADLDPAGLLLVEGAALGVTADASTISLVSVHADPAAGDGSWTAERIASSSPVSPGRNSVRIANGSPIPVATGCCVYLYGTAGVQAARVVIDGADDAIGGEVRGGLWLVILPGISEMEPAEVAWSFLSADGSPVEQGRGVRFAGG